jgi:hypothetical protein
MLDEARAPAAGDDFAVERRKTHKGMMGDSFALT